MKHSADGSELSGAGLPSGGSPADARRESGTARWLFARALFPATLLWNVLLGRVLSLRDWWNEVDDTLCLGAFPFPGDVPRLAEMGVRGVINTCEEYPGPRKTYRRHSIDQLRLPVVDYCPPKAGQVARGLAFIEEHRRRGEKVYVHCKAGRGRSATIALCWLMKSRGLTPEAAMDVLKGKRRHVSAHLDARRVVREVYNSLGGAPAERGITGQSHPGGPRAG